MESQQSLHSVTCSSHWILHVPSFFFNEYYLVRRTTCNRGLSTVPLVTKVSTELPNDTFWFVSWTSFLQNSKRANWSTIHMVPELHTSSMDCDWWEVLTDKTSLVALPTRWWCFYVHVMTCKTRDSFSLTRVEWSILSKANPGFYSIKRLPCTSIATDWMWC